MADQMQTESLDQGATKDSSSINAPGATVNSDDKTSSLAFHNDGTDEESSADRDEGVNDMTNRSINEESGNEVNDKIADDENGIIHETIIKGGSNKVDENKKGNERVSLGANETFGKGEDTFVKRSSETVYRGNGRKNSESNDEVTQKSNNGANDKENNETSDTSYIETKTGTDKKTHAGERHENKTSNDETNLMTSKSGDERNDEAAQKGNNPNEKGNNERNDTTQVEKSKAGIDKITHEGERHENKTSNDETNLMTSKPADERNDEATHKGNNANDKGNNERNDTSDIEKTKTGTGKITHEGASNENKTDNDKTNALISEPANERNDEETQNRNNAIDKGYNETSDTSHAEKTIPGTDKKMHESDENKTENDVTNVLIGKPANEKHNEASYNREGETNNDEKDIVTDSVNADQIDANAKEMGETCGGDSCSNEERNDSETPDEKKIADIGRQETANKETNGEIIPEGAVCNEDANVPQDAPMPCYNESPEAYVESHGKKKKGSIGGVVQDLSPFKRGTKNKKKKETHIPSSQPKQPSVTKSIEADVNSHEEKANKSFIEKHVSKIGFFQKLKSNKTKDTKILDRAPGACSIEEDVKPHDDKKSASSNETHMFNLGFLQKTKSNKKKDRDISDSQAKEAPDACRDSMPIQDENKQWKKKHEGLINQTLEEKKSNAITLNKTTALLQARDRELEEYRADISQLTAQIQQLQEDKSDLLLRLSKVASAKLTQNNPNIADLSDANRPTKLAEQFSELYDNEYTDAIEELKEQQGLEEQAAIENMLTLLQAANKECVEMARKQENGKTCLTTFSFKVDQYPILQERSMLTESGDNECSTVKTTVDQETEEIRIEMQLPDEHRKSLSDIRILCATKVEEDCSMSKIIASKIALQRRITPESGPKTLAYITKCAKLCWYMVIKEPPVLVGFRAVVDGEPFNKDTYRSYTKAGELLDFVVWPPLYLHKDGPLLCKGVAQGK